MIVGLFCQGVLAAGESRIHVDASAPIGGDGLSWPSAMNDLQNALAAAAASGGAITEIWVAEGIYFPDMGLGSRSATFLIPAGVEMYGGFEGDEVLLSDRPVVPLATILSGEIGDPSSILDNSFNVVSMRSVFQPARLDGFIISGGRADGAGYPQNAGGGLLNEGATHVVNCIFDGNYADTGGGVYSRNSGVTFTRCIFQNNEAANEGGGVYGRDGVTALECLFTANNASFGGGMQICCGPGLVRHCEFSANFSNFGGGLLGSNNAQVAVVASRFTNNSASRGAGIYAGTGAWITNSFIVGNSGSEGAGAYFTGSATVVNCLVARNFSIGNGGGVWTGSALSFVNNTVADNRSLLQGGGVYLSNGSTAIANSILWDNRDQFGRLETSQVKRAGAAVLNIRHSAVQAWTGAIPGVNMVDSNPGFVNPLGPDGIAATPDDDYSLPPMSACADAGDNTAVPSDAGDVDANGDVVEPTPLDIGGAPRFIDQASGAMWRGGAMVDIGAYEFAPPGALIGDANGDSAVDFGDIGAVLGNWGSGAVMADVDQSGLVDFGDIGTVLGNWGAMGPV